MYMRTGLRGTMLYADANNDDLLKEHILVTKIAELVLKDKTDVIALLKQYGDMVSMNDDNDFVIRKIVERGQRSEPFVKDLATLMLKKDDISSGKTGYNYAASDYWTPESLKTYTDVIATLGGLFKKDTAKTSSDMSQQLAYLQLMSQNNTSKNSNKFPTWGWILIGFGTIAIVGSIIYVGVRNKA